MKQLTAIVLLIFSSNAFAQLPPTKSGFIKVGSLNIYYEKTGKGSPVFLLHAGLQDNRMWDLQVPALSKKYQVITLDLPAHGKTQGSDTITLMADILRIVMDSMRISKASFVGLSFGAVCVTDITLSYPERVSKAVLVAPGLLGWDKLIAIDSVSKPKLDSLDAVFKSNDTLKQAQLFTRAWCDGPFRRPDQVNKKARAYIFNTTLKNLRLHALDYWPRFVNRNAAEKVNTVRIPVLIINADKDIPLITNVCTFLNKNIKGSKKVTIPNVAHMLNLEAPDAFNKELMTFLSK